MSKIAIAQMDVIRADPDANLERIRLLAGEARDGGARLVGFPEMCTTGFDWEAMRRLKDRLAGHLRSLCVIARNCEIDLFASLPEQTGDGRVANTLVYINAAGSVVARYRKIHRFSLFSEEKHVEAGDEVVVCPTALGPAGLSICYDLRFPELFRACTEKGARTLLLPAAFPHPRLDHWRVLVRARAIENQSFVVAVNQCGPEGRSGKIRYFGHSMVVDPWGRIVLETDEEAGLSFAEIDPDEVDRVRRKMGALDDRRKDLFPY